MVKIASRLVSHAQLEQAESFQACFVALCTPCGVNAAEFERLHGDRHARLFVQLQGRWLSPLLLKIICRSYGGSQRSCRRVLVPWYYCTSRSIFIAYDAICYRY